MSTCLSQRILFRLFVAYLLGIDYQISQAVLSSICKVCSLPMRNKVAFKKVFDIGVILPVILQPAKNLMIFQIKKIKRGDPLVLQPQDGTER